jgi:hypothetical protein
MSFRVNQLSELGAEQTDLLKKRVKSAKEALKISNRLISGRRLSSGLSILKFMKGTRGINEEWLLSALIEL